MHVGLACTTSRHKTTARSVLASARNRRAPRARRGSSEAKRRALLVRETRNLVTLDSVHFVPGQDQYLTSTISLI